MRRIGGIELVSIPDVEIGNVDYAVCGKVTGAPRSCVGELVAVPDIEIAHVNESIQICIPIEECASIWQGGCTGIDQPLIKIDTVDEAIATEVKSTGVCTTGDFGNKCIDIRTFVESVSVKVAAATPTAAIDFK